MYKVDLQENERQPEAPQVTKDPFLLTYNSLNMVKLKSIQFMIDFVLVFSVRIFDIWK